MARAFFLPVLGSGAGKPRGLRWKGRLPRPAEAGGIFQRDRPDFFPFKSCQSHIFVIHLIIMRKERDTMAFFGGQTKTTTSQTVPEPEDRTEDLPQLPEPRTSTIIAQDIVVTGSIHGEGGVQIEGVVEGEVSLQG